MWSIEWIHFGDHSFYWYESFELKNLPSLISIQLDYAAFFKCQRIVFDSMNDWLNDDWDLIRLQSITLGYHALRGDWDTVELNELIMMSMIDIDWLMRSSFSHITTRIWLQFQSYRQSDIEEWWLLIVFELDIPLTDEQIKMKDAFSEVKKMNCSSKRNEWL